MVHIRFSTIFLHVSALVGLLALLVFATLTSPLVMAAHESRTVAGDYELEVGFVNEPAIADEINGVLLEVTQAGQPVEGAGETLEVQILFGDQTKEVTLVPSFETPGRYTAIFIPTVEGEYTFRFVGQIEGAEVDEYFTSSPEGFESVAPRSDYEFPQEDANAMRAVAVPALVSGAILGAVGLAVRQRTSDRAR